MREPRIYVAEHSGKDASRDAVGLVAFNPIGLQRCCHGVSRGTDPLIEVARCHAKI
jgi:hypothetical protein